ncbi:hypothetical protein ACQR1N_08640 [Bradyrhizobium sp. HKCCYLRH1073]|uniref:hypothetical protein n=1 Tax=unclassified Bradyrhizobium TaxID=2631580 RepID=UPI00291706B6|nr:MULTISPECIES: hypothetical protein [unclassified Bradyrhizobium]
MARVHVNDVVKRVKCDIANAVLLKTNERTQNGKYPFAFLQGWAAKLHFTVIVDDSAGLNPGATLIHPLAPAGSTPQSYSTGIGAGVTTQAVRQEDYEYLISFSDLATEFKKPSKRELYNGCQFENGLLLESDLGLAALVNNALKPIESEVLYPGNNVGPGAAPPTTPAKQLADPVGQLDVIAKKHAANKKNELAIDFFGESEAAEIEKRTQAAINNVVKPLYGIASSSSFEGECMAEITLNQNKAIVWSVGVSSNVIKYDQASGAAKDDALKAVQNDFKETINAANKMIAAYKVCAGQKWKDKPKVYDPIDAINETVNFYVTSSGSVTPAWKLARVTAPLASTFASASRKDTNTLILAMGRPVVAPDGSISASQTMNNQVLSSLLSQAIAQRPVP